MSEVGAFAHPERTLAPWEYWPARVFEAPYYATLLAGCLRHRLPPISLARANWALDHGEIGIGSKFATQMAFAQDRFPATRLLPAALPPERREACIRAFATEHGWPVILKPDMGAVGKGLMRIGEADLARASVTDLDCDYILQAWCPLPTEFGVFWQRRAGVGRISGINAKHFPMVTGNGRDTLGVLARAHPRFSPHWALFLGDHDLARVPESGETVLLSFVGSHTMGCRFTDDTHLRSAALLDAVAEVCDSQPGYNFGRLDVRCESIEALRDGAFTVIEANGVASLPTHMFDPRHSLGRAWGIFVEHGRALVDIAVEHRDVPMELASWRDIAARVRRSRRLLDAAHDRALGT